MENRKEQKREELKKTNIKVMEVKNKKRQTTQWSYKTIQKHGSS